MPCLSGCVGLAIHGVRAVSAQSAISANKAAAEQGDAKAQFEMGKAECCAIGSADISYNNVKATSWFCRAARQDYVPAQYWLGRIYAGKPIVGFDPQENIKLMLVSFPKNEAVAALWLTRAAREGDSDAKSALASLLPKLSANDAAQAEAWGADWGRAPCEWAEVIRPS